MVKSNQALQIRLTEPVVFLRGHSTGLDFRGRPVGLDSDAAPAMLRGLLTLRLTKSTRIRSIAVRLEGVSRTEWPEGIGPRRLETFEEHTIISDSATFFDAKRPSSRSQSRSTRRAASVGPGVYLPPPSELSSEDLNEESDPLDEAEGSTQRGRERERTVPSRSASAMPGTIDSGDWYSGSGSGEIPTMSGLRVSDRERERGPSPAYTPRAQSPVRQSSSLRQSSDGSRLSRETVLSPIQSVAPSRSTSDRGDSLDRARRTSAGRLGSESTPLETAEEVIVESPGVEDDSPSGRERGTGEIDEDQHRAIRSILAGQSSGQVSRSGRQSTGGEVRFADVAFTPINGNGNQEEGDEEEPNTRNTRPRAEYPHSNAAFQAVSAVSTAHNSPAPSRPGSIMASSRPSSLRPSSSDDNHDEETDRESLPSVPPPMLPDIPVSTASSRPPSIAALDSSRSSRPVSLRNGISAASSSASLTEVRQGKKNRLGTHSTIVTNTDPTAPPTELPSSPLANGSTSASASTSTPPPPVDHRLPWTNSPYGHLTPALPPTSTPNPPAPAIRRESASGETGSSRRTSSRFSLAATIRGISQDVKDRVRNSSKSRTRQGSLGPGPRDRNGSISASDIPVPAIPSHHRNSIGVRDESTSRSRSTTRQFSGSSFNPEEPPIRRAMRSGSFTQDPNFVPPGGSRGAARINTSRERRGDSTSRNESPAPAFDRRGSSGLSQIADEGRGGRSESRGRGRNKGMKVLTDALGLSEGKVDEEPELAEESHNWKEFKKGTYNYPISFPIPVSTPPTVHAEFGSVSYRLKATIVRVGALTPNLMEEVEVMMIATPQEDDLEESENVIVERQWEEQMRYQIALSGKAFPIGGIIPISLRIMPLMKCKIHRVSCVLEEKTDYYAQGRKVIRHETPRRFTLLFIKQFEHRTADGPLLPIISDSPSAARESPLAPLARAAALANPTDFTNFAGEHDEDALYASMMDPMGPWHLETELQIPDCALKVRFTTKHEKANMSVSHWLKVTIRVERGDDVALDTKGKRKQFDIIIETPIKILDCRVNPQWNSLPTYSSNSPSSTAALSGMCSIHGTKSTAATASTPRPTSQRNGSLTHAVPGPSSSTIAEAVPVRRREDGDDTLLERNIVYDRLMSGQETEEGDIPPSYGEALAGIPDRMQRTGSGEGRRRSVTPQSQRGQSPMTFGRGVEGDVGGRSRSRLRQEV